MTAGRIIWQADAQRQQQSQMGKFWQFAEKKLGKKLETWDKLYQWSITEINEFWLLLSEFCDIRWHIPPHSSAIFHPLHSNAMLGSRWFPNTKLSFAQNLIEIGNADELAIISTYESKKARFISRAQLKEYVFRIASFLQKQGIKPGDTVAGVVGNTWESVVALLATNACGAIWASCSPDFGVNGIYDRLEQIKPKAIFFHTSYRYNGKFYSNSKNITDVLQKLDSSILKIAIQMEHAEEKSQTDEFSFSGIISNPYLVNNFKYVYTEFDHPLYIMFSSGTTGKPKCILHGAGRVLLQHKKELMLHVDLKKNEKLLYFTTCGWMMWNWQISALSVGSCIVTYEGSPSFPDLNHLWKILSDYEIEVFGTSPKFLSACEEAKIAPRDLPQLRTILSTGSPLLPQNFEWVYKNVKRDVHLASISGGTDIISCFMLGNPCLPVRVGEIQSAGLGMAIEAWDESGKAVVSQKGELVCLKPFVSMPLGFLHDKEDKKYREAYFDYYKDQTVWRHGDYIEVTRDGGIIVYGRSDATLNPGGVRIGSAELYRQVERLEEISDSLAIGWLNKKNEEVILLFVQLKENELLTPPLKEKIRQEIKTSLTPRHVPFEIFSVSGIPYTRSGKKVEILVRNIFLNQPIDNLSAVANPQVLDEYKAIAKDVNRDKS